MTRITTDNSLGVLWGAEQIGAFINIDRRKAFYLLETGKIDATKISQQWCTTKERMRRQFGTARVAPTDADPAPTPSRPPSPRSRRGR